MTTLASGIRWHDEEGRRESREPREQRRAARARAPCSLLAQRESGSGLSWMRGGCGDCLGRQRRDARWSATSSGERKLGEGSESTAWFDAQGEDRAQMRLMWYHVDRPPRLTGPGQRCGGHRSPRGAVTRRSARAQRTGGGASAPAIPLYAVSVRRDPPAARGTAGGARHRRRRARAGWDAA